MMKTQSIAICALAIMLLTAGGTVKANQIVDLRDHTDNQLPFPPGPKFFPGGPTEGYLISGPDWGWTHTFDFAGPLPPESITSARLEIDQFGVYLYDEHEIFFDGVSLGYLDNGFPYETDHTTTFILGTGDIANLLDGVVNVWLDIDWPNSVAIYRARLIINYIPAGLDHIVVSGPTEVQEQSGAQYTCTAYFIDSSTSDVTNSAIWSDDSTLASFDSSGFLTTLSVSADEPVQLKATFGSETDTHDITIKNVVPVVSITESIPVAAEAGFNGIVEVSRVGPTNGTLRVFYNTAGSTATSGEDYMELPGIVDILPGETAASISVIPIDDDIEEGAETVVINITPDPSEYTIDPVLFSSTVTIADDEGEAPVVLGRLPARDSIQVARDTIIQLHVTDDSSGVDDVTIHVEGDLIYDSTNESPVGVYDSRGDVQTVRGICRRVGTGLDYTYVFQATTLFDYEQEVDVEVNATDKAGHVMDTDNYSFFTLMRTFGKNIKVNTDTGTNMQNRPDTAMDSLGNIWVVWEHAVVFGDSDIYVGKLPLGGSAFEPSQLVFGGPNDQINPAIAIDENSDKLYVVWQETVDGSRDIFVSTSNDGTIWSPPVKVNTDDPLNKTNQTSPAIAIDGNGLVYVAWEDDGKGSSDKDIWVSTSLDGATWLTPTLIASAIGNQTEPVIDIVEGLTKVPYVFWTDSRGTSRDIFSSKFFGTWAENPIVVTPSDQFSPAVSINDNSVKHLLWVDDDTEFIGFEDIFYGNDDLGLPFEGVSIVDEPGTRQTSPSIAANNAKVFACWQDFRNIGFNEDTDIYYAEKSTGSDFGTNILVNDDLGTFAQTAPVIGMDIKGRPYMVWVDDREGNTDIYASAATSVGPILKEALVDAVNGGIIEIDDTRPGIVDSKDDVIIEFPPGALPADTTIEITELMNAPSLPPGGFGVLYDFGPSGLQFAQPVTITIPHAAADCPGHAAFSVYFYNTETGTWSQDGITNVVHLTAADDPDLPADVHVTRCNASHFTSFGAGGGAAGGSGGGVVGGGGGGGGGGCSVSAAGEGSILEYFLPYIGFVIILLVLTMRDARIRKKQG